MLPTVLIRGDLARVPEVRGLVEQLGFPVHDRDLGRPSCTRVVADIALVATEREHLVAGFVQSIRRDDLARRIVVISELDSPDLLVAAAGSGADGWILPDLPATTLVRTLRGVHEGESAFSRVHVMSLVAALREPVEAAEPVGRGPMSELTPREREIHTALVAGGSTREIAARLSISESTVRWHSARLMKKLGRTDRPSLATNDATRDPIAAAVSPATALPPAIGPAALAGSPQVPNRMLPEGVRADDVHASSRWASLRRAELRVAFLVAEGLSNREIAEHLFISRHTVESHLKSAFAKLQVRSRVELTRFVLVMAALPQSA